MPDAAVTSPNWLAAGGGGGGVPLEFEFPPPPHDDKNIPIASSSGLYISMCDAKQRLALIGNSAVPYSFIICAGCTWSGAVDFSTIYQPSIQHCPRVDTSSTSRGLLLSTGSPIALPFAWLLMMASSTRNWSTVPGGVADSLALCGIV